MADTERLNSQSAIKCEVAPVVAQITPADSLPRRQYRWNTSEEIYSILLAVSNHSEWLTQETRTLPPNGSIILYDKKSVGMAYRRDGYVWKTRKDGKNTREDHMKLRVKGADVISGHYVHSAILSSFHRRSYSLTAQPNIILVHYLNAPVEGREAPLPSLKNCDKRVWSREDLAHQIFPMYDAPNDLTVRKCLNFVPPSPIQINRMIDDLLASQTNENGVKVTAQWVLSLDNNCSYVVHSTQPQNPNTFQIPNRNVQFVLGHIDSGSILQTVTPCQPPAVGVTENVTTIPTTAPVSAVSTQQQHLQYTCDNMSSSQLAPENTFSVPPSHLEQNNKMFGSKPQVILPKPSVDNQHHRQLGAIPYQPTSISNIESQPSYLLPVVSTPSIVGNTSSNSTGLPNLHINHTQHDLTNDIMSLHNGIRLEPCQQSAAINQIPDLEHLNDLPMEISSSLPHTQLTDGHGGEHLNTNLDIYDMSPGEINSTLSANMPNASHSPASPADLSKDLQLDNGFELFSELNVHEEMSNSVFDSSPMCDDMLPCDGKVKLTALAPEWSYAEGGCKVLLVGPWNSSVNEYSCMFGDKSVTAELVQDGVLSCITPDHKQGIVQVKVMYSGKVISESCNFEFRDRKYESSRYRSWFLCEESRLQMALVDRLEMVKCRLDILFPAPILADNMNLEQRVNALVQNIQRYKWRSKEPLPNTSYKGLTLFHLAAALGYRTLLDTLMNWRNECPCDILANEVSTRATDNNGCLPMHWACALGRMETTLIMYYMDRLTLDEVNKEGMTPLSLARAFRNKHIVEMLVQQEHTVLESKLDHQGLNKCIPSLSSPTRHSLRRSASPARRSSPVRHPPVTRHNSTPNSTYLPPHWSLPPPSPSGLNIDTGIHCSTPDRVHTSPSSQFHSGDYLLAHLDIQSELDEEDSIVDVERVSDDGNSSVIENEHNHRIRTLAEHIIAAIPDRIKSIASDDSSSVALLSYRERSSSRSSYSSTPSCAEDSGVCTPLTGDWVEEWNRSRLSSSPCFSADSIYRPSVTTSQSHCGSFYNSTPYYHTGAVTASSGLGTPYHSTPAASTKSYNTGRSDSPPPSAQILGEYFNAGEGVEYGLSQLTLSDTEQRKLYQAAQVIQHAFRQFKDKKQQQREIEAAKIIQTYYRRFKEFTTLRHIQKQQAATLIQSQFRSYYAQKRFKKSRDAALLIQHHYRAYKEHEHFKRSRNAAVLIQQKFRTHYNRKKCSTQSVKDGSGVGVDGNRRSHHHFSPSPNSK